MSRKNLILGGVLVLLIIFVLFLNGPLEKIKYSVFGPKNYLSKIEINDIERMDIIVGEKEVALLKKDGAWKIEGTNDFYVKDVVMGSIIESLKELKAGRFSLVSDNIDKKKDFNTDNSGIKLKISGERMKTQEFVIGKLAPNYENTYVSTFDSSKTYSVTTNLFTPFSQEEWKDTTIFSSEKEGINKIRFQYPNREFTIAKEDGVWRGATPYLFDVDQEKIDKILDIMTNLEAVKIPEQKFEGTGLEKNLIIIEAIGDEINNTIMVGVANEEGMYFAKKSSSDNIYLISSNIEIELDKSIGQLR